MDAHSFNEQLISEFGVSLPADHELFNELLKMSERRDFQQRIGNADVVTTAKAVREIHDQGCPSSIIPFMRVRQPNHCDFYCFDLGRKRGDGECPITVFAVHTTVFGWPSFRSFLNWVKSQ